MRIGLPFPMGPPGLKMEEHGDDISDPWHLFIAGGDGRCRYVDAGGGGEWPAGPTGGAGDVLPHLLFAETELGASHLRPACGGQHRGGVDHPDVPELDPDPVGAGGVGGVAKLGRAGGCAGKSDLCRAFAVDIGWRYL